MQDLIKNNESLDSDCCDYCDSDVDEYEALLTKGEYVMFLCKTCAENLYLYK